MTAMKLITEHVEDVQFIIEGTEGTKNMFIEGIFLQADIKNRNGRVYPKNVLQREVARYMKESINRKNAFGELGHPNGPTINPDRISHLIESLKEDGSNYIGRAKLIPTPMGNIARNIMEAGGKLAVSSRGVGSLKSKNGAMEVCEDFMLATAADIVINPSAPDAFVDGIMEGRIYEWSDGLLIERDITRLQRDINSSVKNKKLNEQAILSLWEKVVKSASNQLKS